MNFIKLTKQLIWITRITFVIFIINTIAATILIIGWHWNGFSTLTSIVTQVILAVQTLTSTHNIAVQSIKRNVPLSTVLQEPTLFNVFDLNITNNNSEKLEEKPEEKLEEKPEEKAEVELTENVNDSLGTESIAVEV
jgi:hypothetical protein